MITRNELIRRRLEAAERAGIVRSWYCYAPGDGWRRWVVDDQTGTHVLRTIEAEAYCAGLGARAIHA